ncbi:hypothetical protein MTR_4g128970 [Medicago truncatula]|uniref:Uncharacterized protein n=1 Tax=Medicago truncatula TaxID=3880 RepID=G7JD50_MEDTR|nr:hypothetical protein MTR_4g128970 [Medicago truncatula]
MRLPLRLISIINLLVEQKLCRKLVQAPQVMVQLESTQAPTSKPSDSLVPPVSSTGTATLKSSNSLEDLTKPLLENDKQGYLI